MKSAMQVALELWSEWNAQDCRIVARRLRNKIARRVDVPGWIGVGFLALGAGMILVAGEVAGFGALLAGVAFLAADR